MIPSRVKSSVFKGTNRLCRKGGVDEENIVLDPGIGFGKSGEDNCRLLRRLADFRCLEGRCL